MYFCSRRCCSAVVCGNIYFLLILYILEGICKYNFFKRDFLCKFVLLMAAMAGNKVYIFDLGGVLLDLDVERSFGALAGLGMNTALLTEKNCLVNEMIQRFDMGDVEEDAFFEYIASCLPASGLSGDALRQRLACAWNMMLGGIAPEKLRVISGLRSRGSRVVMLSNTNIAHWPRIEEIFVEAAGQKPDELFDALYLSFRMHKRKPCAEIFHELLHGEAAAAGDCIFFDDSAENCEAAQRLGIKSVLVKRNASWKGLFDVIER